MKTGKKIGIALSLILGATAALSLAACKSNDGEYTVTFDTRGGSEIAALHLDEGEIVSRPSKNPEKEFFTFDNWYADEKCTELFEFGSAMPAYDITVYAGWIAQESVKVTFDANGGTFDGGDGAVYKVGPIGQTMPLPEGMRSAAGTSTPTAPKVTILRYSPQKIRRCMPVGIKTRLMRI